MIARLRNVSYSYPNAQAPALSAVDLEIAEGTFTLVAGPSAGGKSTLLRVFNGLVPQFYGGRFEGHVEAAGLDPLRTPSRSIATRVGMVFQEPEAQSIADIVEDELAFGMEQQGVPPPEMRHRIDAILDSLRLDHLRHRRLATLSGGERQRVAIGAALVLQPRLLVLDEPTSQLDSAASEAVLASVRHLHRQSGLSVLLAEHRLKRLLPAVQAVIEVDGGLVAMLTPREAAARLRGVPPVSELGRRLGLHPLPLSVDEARSVLPAGLRARPPLPLPAPGDELLAARGLTVAYGEHPALVEADLSVREGEVVALVGPNGSGKTTLFRAIAGTVRPVRGEVRLGGSPAPLAVRDRTAIAGLVPQDPAVALYRETVQEEVAETLRYRNGPHFPVSPRLLDDWGIGRLAARHPRDISVGQQQRVAVAAMLAHQPRLWLLDEPTRGADAAAREWLAARLREHAAAGGAAIVATHDIESAATYASRVIGLDGGRVLFDLPARQAFAANGPLPTQIARLVPGALTAEEVLI